MDDVHDELRQNEYVQDAEDFAADVEEILDNTRDDIHAHFGSDEDEEDEEEIEEGIEEELEEADLGAMEPEGDAEEDAD